MFHILLTSTGRMGWMAHRKWKETRQLPGTAGPGTMLGCCLISFHFRCNVHPIRPVFCCILVSYNLTKHWVWNQNTVMLCARFLRSVSLQNQASKTPWADDRLPLMFLRLAVASNDYWLGQKRKHQAGIYYEGAGVGGSLCRCRVANFPKKGQCRQNKGI